MEFPKQLRMRKKALILILSEILRKRAIKSTICHKTTLKDCAAADRRYMHLNQLNRTRLGKNVKIDGDPFAIEKTDFNVSLILRANLGSCYPHIA